MKYAVSFSVLLLVLSSGILFFQYQVYSSHLEEGNHQFTYSQEIEITYRDNSLDIRQHFRNLSNQAIQIQWPKRAINQSCFMKTKNSCDRLSKDVTSFQVGNSTTQSVSYVIPIEGGLQPKTLIRDIVAELTNGSVRFTTVHISTDTNITGQWVTGLPFIGKQSLSLVNYTMFSGEGNIDDLYWQAGNFGLQYEQPVVSIYASNAISQDLNSRIDKLSFLNEEHIAIIQGVNPTGEKINRMLFMSDLSLKTIERNVILSQVLSQYDFSQSPDWLAEYMASYYVSSDFGSAKMKVVKEQLDNYLSDDQFKQWLDILEQFRGKTITPQALDEKLSKLLEAKTSYFQLNVASKKAIYPVLLEDERVIYIDELRNEEIKMVLYEGQKLYTAEPMLKALGYEAKEGANGYYVNNASRTFRFPEEPGFYVFNQRRYNTISKPVIKIADQYFIEEAWLQRLFLVELEKGDKRIYISSVTTE